MKFISKTVHIADNIPKLEFMLPFIRHPDAENEYINKFCDDLIAKFFQVDGKLLTMPQIIEKAKSFNLVYLLRNDPFREYYGQCQYLKNMLKASGLFSMCPIDHKTIQQYEELNYVTFNIVRIADEAFSA